MNADTGAKAQPWKKLFPLVTPGGEPRTDTTSSEATQTPWKTWQPLPDRPDEKPWYKWMNDAQFNPNLNKKSGTFSDEEKGRGALPRTRTRSKSSSSAQGTVAEGG